MSLNSAMLAGVSGLISQSSAMAVISDNISNVNTTAFKRNRSDFTRLVNAQSAATTYNAGGVTANTRQLIRSQGNINSTSVNTDLAIQGNGFFIVTPIEQIGSTSAEVLFSRVGTFKPDEEGFLVNHANYALRGWRLDDDGAIIGNSTTPSALDVININSISNAAAPSSVASLIGNLKSSTAVSAAAAAAGLPGGYAANSALNMANGAVPSDASWQFQVVDSLGGTKNFTMSFLKSSVPNQWHVEVYSSPASNVNVGAPLRDGQIIAGTLAFNSSGKIDTAVTTPALLAPITIGAHAPAPAAAGAITWADGTGLGVQSFSLDIGQSSTGSGSITQFDNDTGLDSSSSDGSATGELSDLQIDSEGFVTAIFSSGLTKKIYQIPIATFVNPDDLSPTVGGNYRVTGESGPVTLKMAGISGAGKIKSGALEASTVDLALEFSNMILTQRAYSASSKIITTADEMLDELIRMKR